MIKETLFALAVLVIFIGCDDKPEIEEISNNLLKVYPNPVIERAYVTVMSSQPSTLKVFDTKANLILHEKVDPGTQEFTVEVKDRPAGTYQVVLTSGDVTITEKLVKR